MRSTDETEGYCRNAGHQVKHSPKGTVGMPNAASAGIARGQAIAAEPMLMQNCVEQAELTRLAVSA
ncbi:hypothetical protein AALO_G00172140, partial [Alosa alosa]